MTNNQSQLGLSIQNPHILTDDARINKDGLGMGDYSDFNNNSQVIQNINSTNGFTIVSTANQSMTKPHKGIKHVNENVKKINQRS